MGNSNSILYSLIVSSNLFLIFNYFRQFLYGIDPFRQRLPAMASNRLGILSVLRSRVHRTSTKKSLPANEAATQNG